MSNAVAQAIAAVEQRAAMGIKMQVNLPSGGVAMVVLPAEATDADLLTFIVQIPQIMAQARAQRRSPLVLPQA